MMASYGSNKGDQNNPIYILLSANIRLSAIHYYGCGNVFNICSIFFVVSLDLIKKLEKRQKNEDFDYNPFGCQVASFYCFSTFLQE